MERLDKILVSQGVGSRREVQKLIRSKTVAVDGLVVTNADFKVDPQKSVISVSGREIDFRAHIYLMMNKPAGYVCATEDNLSKTVMELVPKVFLRKGLAPVGRLDKDTEGLLILSDDGDFSHKVISPKSGIFKKYYVELEKSVSEDDVKTFENGVAFEDKTKCLPAVLAPCGERKAFVEICEGKFHQVKKMFAACSNRVLYLKRVKIGGLELDGKLPKGSCRELTNTDIKAIFLVK